MKPDHRMLPLLALALCAWTGAAQAFTWSPDMLRSPAFKGQRFLRMPADSTVPTHGKLDFGLKREAADKLVNPVARSVESEARGAATFNTFCYPCHGTKGIADGPVSTKFPGVANLTQDLTKGRTDGYIYFYIRHGGVLMPAYGFGVKPKDAWDVVNYVRKLQGK